MLAVFCFFAAMNIRTCLRLHAGVPPALTAKESLVHFDYAGQPSRPGRHGMAQLVQIAGGVIAPEAQRLLQLQRATPFCWFTTYHIA